MKARHLFLLFIFISFFDVAFTQNKTISSGLIPVLAWGGVPPQETSVERYKEMKEAGILYNLTRSTSLDSMKWMLDMAQKAGIKLIVRCPELKTNPEETVREFMNHPAVEGYFIYDEPSRVAFTELAKWVKRIQTVDKDRNCYINLLPNYAFQQQWGTKTYRKYVHNFIREVPVPFLSFDNYPILRNDEGRYLRENWYENLEIISKEARISNKPFWAFALTVSHGNYPIPTLSELRLQIYSNLAYGAQGIQYFTYWTPLKKTEWNYQHGPISDVSKQRTEVYDRIKIVNREIQSLAGVFLGAKITSVAHTGSVIPNGTKRLGQLPSKIKKIETTGVGAIVSFLEKGEENFVVIVNRDFHNSMKLVLEGDATLKKILKDGTIVPANTYLNTLEIDPGDIAIYSWNETF